MDPIFSAQWTPSTPAAYFGTWVFIFFLGVISRGLLALKTTLEGYWFRKHASTAVIVSTNDDEKNESCKWWRKYSCLEDFCGYSEILPSDG